MTLRRAPLSSSPVAALGVVTCVLSLVALGRPHTAEPGTGTLPSSAPPVAVVVRPIPTGPIDINTASVADLERLPRVGPALAERIARGRPYGDVAELDRVPGIGPRTIERLRELVTVSPPPREP